MVCQITGTFIVVTVISFLSSTSILAYWAMIGQMQMLFLLLTRWLTSNDVRAMIKASGFAINIYEYLPLSK